MQTEASTSDGTVRLAFDLPRVTVVQQAAPPETLTQKNIEAVTGIPASTYLDLCRRPDFTPKITRLGKLRIVGRVDFVAWVAEHGEVVAPRAPGSTPEDVIAEVVAERKVPPAPKSRTRRT